MKKVAKKNPKASRKKTVKDLEVKPSRGGAVRGGMDKLPGGSGGGVKKL